MRARMFTPENRKWWTLAAVAIGLFMIMLDNTVVNVALPSIQHDLGIGLSELEWVVNAYALTFGVLLLSGGKLADLLGRRAIFIAGLVIFTGASLWCGLAGGAASLIAARTVQGVGAALMNPATLSIITATFPPRQRGTAIGIWAGVSALALAIGPIVGGLLTEKVSWSWIFFINIPVGVLGVLAARVFIDESKDTSREQRLDLPGLVTSGIGLFALTYGLIETNTHSWTSARVLTLFAIAVAARFSDRIGARWLMGAGMTLLAVSLTLFGTLDARSSFWNILPGLLIGGVGMATTMAPTTAAAMGSVPVAKAGVGSAVINSMRQVGGSLGIAVMGALVATRVGVPQTNPLWAGEFVAGYHRAVHLGAALVLMGAIISVVTVRPLPRHEAAAEPAIGA